MVVAPDYGLQFISTAHFYRVQVEDALDGYAGINVQDVRKTR